MVKLSPMLDGHKTVADFAGAVHEVHIVSTGNECKELLLVLGRGRYASPLVVRAGNDEQVLSYKAGDNSDNHTTISDSALAARNTCNTEDSLSEESANDFDLALGVPLRAQRLNHEGRVPSMFSNSASPCITSARIATCSWRPNLLPIFQAGHSPSNPSPP